MAKAKDKAKGKGKGKGKGGDGVEEGGGGGVKRPKGARPGLLDRLTTLVLVLFLVSLAVGRLTA